jgi:general secretion pathway protein A
MTTMYHRHFGLNGPPFQFTPAPRQLFMSDGHREGLATLEWAVLHEPSGFTLLVGEAGTGKTTLVMAILARDYTSVRITCVTNPKLGFDSMLRAIARQFGIEARPEKSGMLDAFDRFLADLRRGERVVIILDEAQSLNDETLEELRLFSNRGRADEKQLHFVLVGQPELLRRLTQPHLRQLNDRIGARAVLNSLTPEEAVGYVEYRTRTHGGSPAAIFTRGALPYLIDHSGGIPRRINLLCHNAMLLAYSAGLREVDLPSARAAVSEYENLFASARPYRCARVSSARRVRRFLRAAPPVAVVFALGLLSFGVTFVSVALEARQQAPSPSVAPAASSSVPGPAPPIVTASSTIPPTVDFPVTPAVDKASVVSGTKLVPGPKVRHRWRHSRHSRKRVATRRPARVYTKSWWTTLKSLCGFCRGNTA